jgi:Ca2+/Na+ antiporter
LSQGREHTIIKRIKPSLRYALLFNTIPIIAVALAAIAHGTRDWHSGIVVVSIVFLIAVVACLVPLIISIVREMRSSQPGKTQAVVAILLTVFPVGWPILIAIMQGIAAVWYRQ